MFIFCTYGFAGSDTSGSGNGRGIRLGIALLPLLSGSLAICLCMFVAHLSHEFSSFPFVCMETPGDATIEVITPFEALFI